MLHFRSSFLLLFFLLLSSVRVGAQKHFEFQRTFGGAQDDGGHFYWNNVVYRGGGKDVLKRTDDGGYIVGARTSSFGAGSKDIYILKLGPDGCKEWSKIYGGSNGEMVTGIVEKDGAYYVSGATGSFGINLVAAYLLKLDSNGTLLWDKYMGGGDYDRSADLYLRGDTIVLSGWTESLGVPPQGEKDAYVAKFDTSGQLYSWRAYGGGGADRLHASLPLPDSGGIHLGFTNGFGTNGRGYYLMRTKA